MKKERVTYIDIILALGLIMAILFGTGICGGKAGNVFNEACPWIFMAAYGGLYFEKNIREKKVEYVIKKSCMRLLVPYIIFSLIACAIEACKYIFISDNKNITTLKTMLLEFASLKGVCYTGFFTALFIGVNAYGFIRKKCNLLVTGIFVAVFLAYVIYISKYVDLLTKQSKPVNVFLAGICYTCLRGLIGLFFVFVGEVMARLLKGAEKMKIFTGIDGILILIVVILFTKETRLDSMELVFGNIYLYMALSIAMVASVYIISWWISESMPLIFLGRNSKILYLGYYVLGIKMAGDAVAGMLFVKFDNYFIMKAGNIALVIILEAALIAAYKMICKRVEKR